MLDTTTDLYISHTINVESFDITKFTPFTLTETILTFIGGESIKTNISMTSISYMNFNDFIKDEELTPCITTVVAKGCQSIGAYIYNENPTVCFVLNDVDTNWEWIVDYSFGINVFSSGIQ